MKLISKLWLCLPLCLFLSFAATQKTASSVATRSYSYESKSGDNLPLDPAIKRFTVPPELGIIKGKINAIGTSFTEVVELLITNSNQLEKGISQTKACSFNLLDYQHPLAWDSPKSLVSNGNKYSGSLEFEILISLAETKNIQERIKQVNNCLQAIPSLQLELTQKDKDMNINLSLSRVLLTVKDASKYRQELLEFKSKPFKEVANLSEPAIQFDATDIKCTSEGIVRIVTRNFSGIELDIDFNCRRITENQLNSKD